MGALRLKIKECELVVIEKNLAIRQKVSFHQYSLNFL